MNSASSFHHFAFAIWAETFLSAFRIVEPRRDTSATDFLLVTIGKGIRNEPVVESSAEENGKQSALFERSSRRATHDCPLCKTSLASAPCAISAEMASFEPSANACMSGVRLSQLRADIDLNTSGLCLFSQSTDAPVIA